MSSNRKNERHKVIQLICIEYSIHAYTELCTLYITLLAVLWYVCIAHAHK